MSPEVCCPQGRLKLHRRGAWRSLSGALALCTIASAPAWAERPAPDLKAGQAAYVQSCARCHGATGKGDGVDAKRFYPRPRDFTVGVYKFRSTASGTPPTDEDLYRTISHGLPGTNMPDWPHLDDPTRWQLVAYLKSLSPVFTQAEPKPVTLAPDPGPQRADVSKGKATFQVLGCAACHGPQGRANGTSAGGLVDDWGWPVRPADLTQGWAYRGGSDPRAIMTRLLAGIDGSGMPSYAEAVSPEDAWPLAYYVASLQEPAHWNMIAHPLFVDGPLPTAFDDPRWAQAEQTDVRVRNVVTPEGEWREPPTIRAVTFRAVYDREGLALRFSWDDPTREATVPPDGLAWLLKPADHQGDVVTLQAWPIAEGPALDLCYWSADRGQAIEAVSDDYEAVRTGRAPHETLESVAAYDDGRWTLILQRPFHPMRPAGAAAMTSDGFTSMAVAIWDGGNPAARAVSPWVELVLHPPAGGSTSAHAGRTSTH